jgi:hypothetical protein
MRLKARSGLLIRLQSTAYRGKLSELIAAYKALQKVYLFVGQAVKYIHDILWIIKVNPLFITGNLKRITHEYCHF